MKNIALLRRVGTFLTGNILAQGLAAISGLLLARWMTVSDYGLYTIVITVMGAITVLTKGGVHLGYTAILGREWPNMYRVAEAINAALSMRKLISIFILPFILIFTYFILLKNNLDKISIIIILIVLLAFWWADLKTRLIDQVIFFAKQTTKIQILDMNLSLLRFFFIVSLYFFGKLDLYFVLAISVLVAILRIKPIFLWVKQLLPIDAQKSKNKNDINEIKRNVKRQLPVEVYYVFQAQIIFFVLTYYGGIHDVAGFGALSRINQLLLPIEGLTYAFLIPFFTKGSVSDAKRIFIPLVLLTMIPGCVLTCISFFFPKILLWIVGNNYSNLHDEIFIACLVAMITRGVGTAWSLLAHRGWVKFSWIQIPIGLFLCALSPLFLNLGTVSGALLLQLVFVFGLLIATILDFYFADHENE